MENIKNRPGTGPQVSFLTNEEFYMSPALFKHMKHVQSSYRNKTLQEEGPVDYEGKFKLSSELKHHKIKSDVWALGATMLYAGNLKSIKSIYDNQTFEIDEKILNNMINEFD